MIDLPAFLNRFIRRADVLAIFSPAGDAVLVARSSPRSQPQHLLYATIGYVTQPKESENGAGITELLTRCADPAFGIGLIPGSIRERCQGGAPFRRKLWPRGHVPTDLHPEATTAKNGHSAKVNRARSQSLTKSVYGPVIVTYMPEHPHLVDELFDSIPLAERQEFLYRAGIYSTAPADFIGQQLWREQNRPRFILALLRRFDFRDEQVLRAISEGDLKADIQPTIASVTLELSLFQARGPAYGIPLAQLAATSGVMLEVFRDVAATLQPVGLATDPPSVVVAAGSVNFTTPATPLATSVGLLLYCLGLVSGPHAIAIASGLTASRGIIDLALKWTDRVAEIRKKNAETGKLSAEAQKLTAEANKLDAETQRVKQELAIATAGPRVPGVASPAAAALVPPAEVHAAAERFGINEAFATHILNRGLPTAIEARAHVPEIRVSSSQAAGA